MDEQNIKIDIGAGELIDKITILQIKAERISDADKLKNIHYELAMLVKARDTHLAPSAALTTHTQELKNINAALWDIEDDIRALEAAQDFGSRFVALARAVYKTNDSRAAIKKAINVLTGAAVVEEKSYTAFD